MPRKTTAAAHHTPAASRRRSANGAPRGDVMFFIGAILFLVVTLGSVIVAQKMTIHYISAEFPRVAEHNYRALQTNLRAVEMRLTQQLAEVSNACIRVQQLPPPNFSGIPIPSSQIVP